MMGLDRPPQKQVLIRKISSVPFVVGANPKRESDWSQTHLGGAWDMLAPSFLRGGSISRSLGPVTCHKTPDLCRANAIGCFLPNLQVPCNSPYPPPGKTTRPTVAARMLRLRSRRVEGSRQFNPCRSIAPKAAIRYREFLRQLE